MIKEKILALIAQDLERPLMDIEIKDMLEMEDDEFGYLKIMLHEMVEDGYLIETKKKKYGTPEMFSMVAGKIQITQKGFGFVLPDNKEVGGDIFIPPSELGGAMNADRVLCKVTKKALEGKRIEGTVIKVVKRANEDIVGTYTGSGGFGFVVPDDKRIHKDIYISSYEAKGAQSGDKVVVKVTEWPTEDRNPEGVIVEILGQKGDPGVDILSIIRKYKLPEEFPSKVLHEAEKIDLEVDPEEIPKRRDLRDHQIVTIDGEDAKDLDDAISVEKLPNGHYLLGVHIADVSFYVREGAALDREALSRATSVYLIDRVIPMLPERLSNGICSLNPNVDRLTLSCNMEIDSQGKVLNHEIYQSVINSKARMTYTAVSDILEGKNLEAHSERYGNFFELFKHMEELCLILRAKRERRGAIDFDFPEPKVLLDDAGKPVDIRPYERRVANRVIEEFMLAANETVAEHFFMMDAPFVYRIHENPTEEKLATFSKFIHNFGYELKGVSTGNVEPKFVQNLLAEVEGKKEAHIINKLMLRSLKQARYSPNDEGHFGLAAEHYCHFTSPIRRYPDLQIHRIIREFITNKMTEERLQKLHGIVETASNQASEQERVAEQAERDTDDLKKAEYMVQFIGEEFNGIISSVTSFGMFIELQNTVEGLVRVADLADDYYIFDDEHLRLIGEHTKKKFTIGDAVIIKVEDVDVDNREVDFSIVAVIREDGTEEKQPVNLKRKSKFGKSVSRAAKAAEEKENAAKDGKAKGGLGKPKRPAFQAGKRGKLPKERGKSKKAARSTREK